MSITSFRTKPRTWWGAQGRVVAVVLCGIFLASCKAELYTDLDQQHANEMVAALRDHGIPADRAPGKGNRISVLVDESRFAEAFDTLREAGLPRPEFQNLGEVFKQTGLVSSPVEERARMIYALSQELSQTVSEIDGVLSARVHLVLPENDPLRQQLLPSSASVFIRYRANVGMKDLVPQIKMLVANGVAGLSYDKVSVVLVAAAEHEVTGPGMRRAESGGLTIGRISVAGWPLYSIIGAAVLLLCGGAFTLWYRSRVYDLDDAGPMRLR